MSPNNPRNPRGFSDSRKQIKDEFQDIAKLGGDILKKTVVSSMGVIKEVTDGLPKEATQMLAKGKEEFFKNIATKEVMQFLVTQTIDRVFDIVRQHKLEISVRIRKVEEKPEKATKGHAGRAKE